MVASSAQVQPSYRIKDMTLAREGIDRFFDYDIHVDSRTIWIGDGDEQLDKQSAQHAVKALHLLGTTPDKPISILLNSFGGCWFNGMAIYDAIKASPCHIDIVVVGAAMSMGSIILQAADTRIIYPNATVMVHDGYEGMSDVTPLTFQNWAEHSKKLRTSMYRIFAERSGKPVSFWRKKCAADLILTAQEAKELGLVDSIYGEEAD